MPDQSAPAGAQTADAAFPTGSVTFLFTDVEGSTVLLREAGASYGDLLAEHRRLLRAAFEAHGGREVDTQGDSFFVAFGSPTSAVAAAADGQLALAGHPWPPDCAVRVRMGLHTGEATEEDGAYVSLAVHRAARIAAAGHGGQVLLSEATAGLVRDGLPDGATLHNLTEHRLKDFPAPARLYQLDLAGLPVHFPPLRTAGGAHRLPRPPGSIVGREQDLAALVALLRDSRTRLVTLTGPGGIGKTRLALEAAHAVAADFPGGAVFVPVASISDPSLVLGAVADALGARREPGQLATDAIAAAVGDDRSLLLLDNLEQVTDAAGDLAELVERVPALVLMVTSRSLLRLRVEQQFAVPPLAVAAGTRLFAERAAAGRPGAVADDGPAADIVRRLDGLPLAIELAAARVRLLSPAALLERLRDRLDVLGRGPVDLPERQRTLRATMDWSHDLLPPQEQALFARLAVFSGGWSLDAAEEVCELPGEPDLLDTLDSLVAASLVVPVDTGADARFHMLETVHAYAAERLAASEQREQTERRHTAWVLGLARTVILSRGADYRRAQDRFHAERANVRAAARRLLDTGDLAPLAVLIRDSIGYFALRDTAVESLAWLDEALGRIGPGAPAVRGRLLVLAAMASVAQGDMSRITALVTEGEALLPPHPDYDLDRAFATVGGIQRALEERGPEGALRAMDDAMARFRSLGVEFGEVAMHQAAGEMSLGLGRLDRAVAEFRTGADLAERVGDDAMLGFGLSLLGLSQVLAGDLTEARSSLLAGVRVNRRSGWPTGLAYSVEGLAALALAEGRPAVAAHALSAADVARGTSAMPLSPGLPPLIAQLAARCREKLGDAALEAAWEEGSGEELAVALDRALADLGGTSAGSGDAGDE